MLGKDAEIQPVTIAGGTEASLAEWLSKFRQKEGVFNDEATSPAQSSTLSSAPMTPGAGEQDEEVLGTGADDSMTTMTPPVAVG